VGEEDNAADFDKAPLRGFDFDFCHGGVATMGFWSELGVGLNRLWGELTVEDDVRVDVVVSQLVNLEIRLAMLVGSLNIPLKVALSLRVFMPYFPTPSQDGAFGIALVLANRNIMTKSSYLGHALSTNLLPQTGLILSYELRSFLSIAARIEKIPALRSEAHSAGRAWPPSRHHLHIIRIPVE